MPEIIDRVNASLANLEGAVEKLKAVSAANSAQLRQLVANPPADLTGALTALADKMDADAAAVTAEAAADDTTAPAPAPADPAA